jgi:DNA recombination protein RmuC
LLPQAQSILTDAFRSLVADSLRRNKDRSLALAMANLATLEACTVADFDARQKGIEGVVAPVKESLQRMGEQRYAI